VAASYVTIMNRCFYKRSIGLSRCYINIAITVLDINHSSVFYLKQRFGDCILSLFSGGTYSVGLNGQSLFLSPSQKRCVLNKRQDDGQCLEL
jgi:hypothetical protein